MNLSASEVQRVLDSTAFADSRHVKTVARLDEGDLVLRQRIPSWRAANARRASVVVLLRFPHGMRDGVFEKVRGHSLISVVAGVGWPLPPCRGRLKHQCIPIFFCSCWFVMLPP